MLIRKYVCTNLYRKFRENHAIGKTRTVRCSVKENPDRLVFGKNETRTARNLEKQVFVHHYMLALMARDLKGYIDKTPPTSPNWKNVSAGR